MNTTTVEPLQVESERYDAERYLRTEFLERLAHELRGPAGVALGVVDEIERALGTDELSKQAGFLSMARRSALRILRIAERLSYTSQLEAGACPSASTSIDVAFVLDRAIREAEQIEGRAKVRVERPAHTEPYFVVADSTWLCGALAETVAAALRSAISAVGIEITREGQHVHIIVRTDGSALLDSNTERFVANGRRDTGLVTPFVSDVVRAQGGQLQLEASENGRVARIVFPAV